MPRFQCTPEVAAKGKLSNQDAEDLLKKVNARAARIAREQGLSQADSLREAVNQLSQDTTRRAAKIKFDAAENLRKRLSLREDVKDFAAAYEKATGKPGFGLALRKEIVPINWDHPEAEAGGQRASAENVWNARESQYASGLNLALKKAGVRSRIVTDRTFEKQWGTELWHLSAKDSGDARGTPGITKNADALKVANIVNKFYGLANDRLNRAGADIGDLAGYIGRTVHNPDKMLSAGFDKWKSDILPKLDEATFDGVGDRDRFLKSSYDGLTSGIHLTDAGGAGEADPRFTGNPNLAKKLSQGRTLQFKDAEGWLDYQQAYGSGPLLQNVLSSLSRAARSEALLERFGTNPRSEFDNHSRWLQEQNRDNPAAMAEMKSTGDWNKKLFDRLTGESDRPVNVMAAQWMAGLRTVQSMAKLGAVLFSHFGVAVSKSTELMRAGIHPFEAYGSVLSSLVKGDPEAADRLLAYHEGARNHMMSQFHVDDRVPQMLSKISGTFHDLTMLPMLFNMQKGGTMLTMARHLGGLVDSSMDRLKPEDQRTMRLYDISPADWDALRQAPDHLAPEGRVHLTPDAADRASDGDIKAALGKPDASEADVASYRDRLGLKLHNVYQDMARRSVVTAGIGDREIFLQGTRPGTLAGEVARTMGLFKGWAIASTRQQLGGAIQGGANRASSLMNLAVSSAIVGYGILSLKEMVKGNTPPSWKDPRTMMEALIQGGGFGIIGDLGMTEPTSYGRSGLDVFAGPVLGQISDIYKLHDAAFNYAHGVVTGDHTEAKAAQHQVAMQALHIGLNNTPGLNLFYARAAINHLFLNSLNESMNPGSLARAQANLKKRGQAQLGIMPSVLRPENHLKPFGR